MVTTESLVDSVMFRWLSVNFPIQASPSWGFLGLSYLSANARWLFDAASAERSIRRT